jgi:ABC-type lipoprotein export system ATPase subunit
MISTESRDNISTGEKRRIGIARALVGNPDIVVFDEVTSNLDANTKNKIMKMLLDECAEKTCIYITHDKDLLSCCDTIYEMRDGLIHLVKKQI